MRPNGAAPWRSLGHAPRALAARRGESLYHEIKLQRTMVPQLSSLHSKRHLALYWRRASWAHLANGASYATRVVLCASVYELRCQTGTGSSSQVQLSML